MPKYASKCYLVRAGGAAVTLRIAYTRRRTCFSNMAAVLPSDTGSVHSDEHGKLSHGGSMVGTVSHETAVILKRGASSVIEVHVFLLLLCLFGSCGRSCLFFALMLAARCGLLMVLLLAFSGFDFLLFGGRK